MRLNMIVTLSKHKFRTLIDYILADNIDVVAVMTSKHRPIKLDAFTDHLIISCGDSSYIDINGVISSIVCLRTIGEVALLHFVKHESDSNVVEYNGNLCMTTSHQLNTQREVDNNLFYFQELVEEITHGNL